MKRVVLALMLLLLTTASVYAQDPCATAPPPPDVLTAGRPYTVTWAELQNVVVNGTSTPNRIDGFAVSILNQAGTAIVQAETDIGKPPQVNCGTTRWGFTWNSPTGIAKGSYIFAIRAYNFVLDANGNPTTTKQYSATSPLTTGSTARRPFDVVDPVLLTAPPEPTDIRVR